MHAHTNAHMNTYAHMPAHHCACLLRLKDLCNDSSFEDANVKASCKPFALFKRDPVSVLPKLHNLHLQINQNL